MFQDFKPILKILLRFLLIYLMLLGVYQLYLNVFSEALDPVSQLIARQVTVVQNTLGYPSQLYDVPERQATYFYVSGDYRSYMVEGCNAISVMILFVAFIFAFYKGKKTFAFVGVSLVLLYTINVLRIAGINIINVEYPKYSQMGHDYLFPAIIYGSVVILWLIWIKRFALKV